MSVALTSRHSHLIQHSPKNLQRDVQTATIPEPNSHIRRTYLASQPSELSFTKKCSKKCAHALVGEIKCAKCLDVLTNSSNFCRKPSPVSVLILGLKGLRNHNCYSVPSSALYCIIQYPTARWMHKSDRF